MIAGMPEEQAVPGYSAAERIVALIGLVVVGGLVFILADVISGGKLTGRGGCGGCGDKETASD